MLLEVWSFQEQRSWLKELTGATDWAWNTQQKYWKKYRFKNISRAETWFEKFDRSGILRLEYWAETLRNSTRRDQTEKIACVQLRFNRILSRNTGRQDENHNKSTNFNSFKDIVQKIWINCIETLNWMNYSIASKRIIVMTALSSRFDCQLCQSHSQILISKLKMRGGGVAGRTERDWWLFVRKQSKANWLFLPIDIYLVRDHDICWMLYQRKH